VPLRGGRNADERVLYARPDRGQPITAFPPYGLISKLQCLCL